MHKTYRLNNGLPVVSYAVPHFQSVSIGIITGAALFQESLSGEAHFLEHMCFRGTQQHTAKQIVEIVDTMGGYINAMTSRDYTLYYITVPTNYATEALALIIDLYTNSVLDEAAITKEKSIVLEEINMVTDTPDDYVHDLLYDTCFTKPFGNSILGTATSLAGITHDTLRRFRDIYFHTDQTRISLAGPPDALDKLHRALAKLDWPTPETDYQPGDPVALMPVAKLHQKETEQTHICLGFQGCTYTSDQRYSYTVLAALLGGTMSSRLFQEIREKRGWAYSVYSHCSFHRHTGVLMISAGIGNQYFSDTLNVIRDLLNDLATNGLESGELQKIKQYLKGSIAINLETSTSWMMFLAKMSFYQPVASLDTMPSLDRVIASIDRVSESDILALAGELTLSKAGLSVIGPVDPTNSHRDSQPTETVLAKL